MPEPTPRPAETQDKVLDALIIGAGFSGLYQLHCLRDRLGLRRRCWRPARRRRHLVLEPLSRRALRFREPFLLLLPSPTSCCRIGSGPSAIPGQPEILRYLNHVADRFDLKRDIRFDTRVTRRALRRGGESLAGHDRSGRDACGAAS